MLISFQCSMISHRRMGFWDVVMNKSGEPTPETPPATPVTCRRATVEELSYSLPRLLPPAANEVKKILSAPKQNECSSRVSSISATSTLAPSDGGHSQKTSTVGSSERAERISAVSLGERRAQRSDHSCKQPLLLQPPLFKRGHEETTRNSELIRRLLTSEAPWLHHGVRLNNDKPYR
jgi:hypothetical protein